LGLEYLGAGKMQRLWKYQRRKDYEKNSGVRKAKVSELEVMAVAVSYTAGAVGHAEVKCRHSQVADSMRGR
jgi:hypothetical protein